MIKQCILLSNIPFDSPLTRFAANATLFRQDTWPLKKPIRICIHYFFMHKSYSYHLVVTIKTHIMISAKPALQQ